MDNFSVVIFSYELDIVLKDFNINLANSDQSKVADLLNLYEMILTVPPHFAGKWPDQVYLLHKLLERSKLHLLSASSSFQIMM